MNDLSTNGGPKMLRVALPSKGTLAAPASEMLTEAGYRQRHDPKDLTVLDTVNEVEFFFLRPRDISVYVGSGELDLGITGRDLVLDSEAPVTERLALGTRMIELAGAVYGIDLTAPGDLSIRELANAFAAFRWGGLLRLHRTSAMEFPYSVAGLTEQYSKMRWPNIDEPNTPDRPGGRFRGPFGAVPVVVSLDYPATV